MCYQRKEFMSWYVIWTKEKEEKGNPVKRDFMHTQTRIVFFFGEYRPP